MVLTEAQLRELSELVDMLQGLPEAARAQWLANLGPEQAAYRSMFQRLFGAEESPETRDFLATLPKLDEVAVPDPGGLTAGAAIGPYRLLRELGRGGMGTVWLAERSDGALKRAVALKLPHTALPQGQLAERFARERNILAALTHPNIARLYDAGITAQGQPYLALEFVEGEPMLAWCDAHQLGVHERIELFLQALAAVQYAHGQLIIHRDLKPSNILVTAQGQVRLLDFGIAKLLTAGEARETELTQVGGRALTPEYASPEQIMGQPMGTASDVYALGVLFYQLLTGVLPYRVKRGSRGALEDAILGAEPPRPSQSGFEEARATARGTTAKRLARQLAGDLDTIVLKALKKVPAERYPTAQALAEDIRRYLSGHAVLARPDSTLYRTRKFVVRHWLSVSAAAGVVLALAAGGTVAIWEANVARQQARVAEHEALHAQTVQRFLLEIFNANSDKQKDPMKARATTARELLDIGASRAANELKNVPEAQNEVLGTLADMYAQMKLYEPAIELRRQQVEAAKRAFGGSDPRVAEALLELATDIGGSSQRGELKQLLDEAERILDLAGDRDSPLRGRLLIERAEYFRYLSLPKMREYADGAAALFRTRYPDNVELLSALRLAALARSLPGEADQAEPIFRELLNAAQRLFPNEPARQISALVDLAQAQNRLAKVDEAEANFRRAWELSKKINGEFNADALQTQAKLGGQLYFSARRAEGLEMLFGALNALGRQKGNDAPNTVSSINQFLGMALTTDGRLEEARRYLDAEVDDLRQNYPRSMPLNFMLVKQADWSTESGRYAEARARLDEADAIWNQRAPGLSGPQANVARYSRVRLLLAQGHGDEALAQLDRVALPSFGAAAYISREEVTTRLLRARAQLQRERYDEAIDEAVKTLEAVQQSPVRGNFVAAEAEAEQLYGQALRGQREYASARIHLERALELLRSNEDPRSPRLAQGEIELAQCYLDLRSRSVAQQLEAQARVIHAAHSLLGEHYRAPLRDLQGRLAASR